MLANFLFDFLEYGISIVLGGDSHRKNKPRKDK